MRGVQGGPSLSFNPYAYVQNNPINYVDPTGEFAWLPTIWAAAKLSALIFGGATLIDAGNQVRVNLHSGMSLGDAVSGVDGWGSIRRGAEWGVSAGIGYLTGAYTAARVTHGLMTAGRAAMINNSIDIGTGFFWETVVNRNGAGSAAFNALAGSTLGGILGASGKGAGWLGRQFAWSPRWAFANGGNPDHLNGGNILRMAGDSGRQMDFDDLVPGTLPEPENLTGLPKVGSQTNDGTKNANLLAANLGPPPEGMIEPRPHHIVPGRDYRVYNARVVLARYGVDINSAANGVWLPNEIHRSIHTKTYMGQINAILSNAESHNEVIAILETVRSEILKGKFPKG